MASRPGLRALDRLLLRELLALFASTLGGVVLLYLVIDFADRASIYRGPGWGALAALLYLNKAAVVAHQLAPAALIIATVLLVTQLVRRGELTALRSLGVRPARLLLPVAGFTLLLCCGLVLLQEKVVVFADARAEEITARRFGRWFDYGFWHAESSWVHGRENRIFRLGPQRAGGFEPVSVLELGTPFRLVRRLDAARLEPAGPGRWRLLGVRERRYGPPGPDAGAEPAIREQTSAESTEPFPDTLEELSLRNGRPRQMPYGALREQAARRARLGLPSREYSVALAERTAAPLLVLTSALAGLALALARSRRDGARARLLSGALALGLVLALGLWALTVALHAAAVGGSLSPTAAAALPPLLCTGLLGLGLRGAS